MSLARMFLTALACLPAVAAAECRMMRFAEWPVRIEGERLMVDASINGRKVALMLHTGMPHSLMPRASADALGVARRQKTDTRSGGAPVELAFVDELRIGDSVHKDWRLLVFALPEYAASVAGIVGYDLFRQADVEFDLARNAVRLYRTQDCGSANLAYWARAEADKVWLDGGEVDGIAVPVRLNGHAVLAELNSASGSSALDRALARRLGVIESFALGAEKISHPAMRVADLGDGYTAGSFVLKRELKPVQLGLDFLRAHRVLVAHSQGTMYFTYQGGAVFTP